MQYSAGSLVFIIRSHPFRIVATKLHDLRGILLAREDNLKAFLIIWHISKSALF
jgi:hypothetical protein